MFRKYNNIIIVLMTVMCICVMPFTAVGDNEMPSFRLKNVIDGKIVDSKELADKVVLIAFFATWCPPCRVETPDLVKLQNEYGPEGFAVIGMAMDGAKTKAVKAFSDEFGINYPVLVPSYDIIQQYGGIYSIPTSFLVDRKGNVVKMYRGVVSYRKLTKDLKAVL